LNGKPVGRSVRLFLVDGSPTGLVCAEVLNWTGHVLTGPRSRLPELLKREEAGRVGIYLLVGEDPEMPSKSRVCVGEGGTRSGSIPARSSRSWNASSRVRTTGDFRSCSPSGGGYRQ
jgi:hypothetical protein